MGSSIMEPQKRHEVALIAGEASCLACTAFLAGVAIPIGLC